MSFLQKTKNFFLEVDTENFYKIVTIFFGTVFLIFAGLSVYYFKTISTYKKNTLELYKKEEQAEKLFERLKNVEKQKELIDALLEKEKNFKIKNFFEDIIKKLNLVSKQKGSAKLTEEDVLDKQYTQVTLQVQFQNINTEMLCKFLQELEEKERIYTKEVIITKNEPTTISTQITFATITARSKKNKIEKA